LLGHFLIWGGAAIADQTPIRVPRPVAQITAQDRADDSGKSIDVTWAPADAAPISFEILRATSFSGPFERVGVAPAGASAFTDSKVQNNTDYWYQVVVVGADGVRSAPAVTAAAVQAKARWFFRARLWFGIVVLTVCVSIITFIQLAKAGAPLTIRKIAGLQAVEEAIGRATEMGRDILFIPGVEDMNDIQTIAGINILGRVARLAAEHGADLEIPTRRSLVMTTARETVAEAYLAAGRPEAYNSDRIHYVTDEQFAFAAAVSGYMVRERPAACFYMGLFFAESLIFAETANSIGAIQVAGTAEVAQLPFFVAAADYTLIGEEFFAASAYLSGEPAQLGSLKGQDVGKVLAATLIGAGFVLAAVNALTGAMWARTAVHELVAMLGSS